MLRCCRVFSCFGVSLRNGFWGCCDASRIMYWFTCPLENDGGNPHEFTRLVNRTITINISIWEIGFKGKVKMMGFLRCVLVLSSGGRVSLRREQKKRQSRGKQLGRVIYTDPHTASCPRSLYSRGRWCQSRQTLQAFVIQWEGRNSAYRMQTSWQKVNQIPNNKRLKI